MPITPIEMLSIATKSQEASLVKQAQHQRPISEQISMEEKFNEDIKHRSEATVAPTKGDTPEFRYDAKERSNNPYYYQAQKKKEKKKINDDKEQSCCCGIDIRI